MSKFKKLEIQELYKFSKLRFNVDNVVHKKILESTHFSLTKKSSILPEHWVYLGFSSAIITKELNMDSALLGLILLLYLSEYNGVEINSALSSQKRLKNRIEIGKIAIKITDIAIVALKKGRFNDYIKSSSDSIAEVLFNVCSKMFLY